MDYYDVVKKRKSVRKYTSQKVPDDVLQRVLDAARWAPSWGNKQCWRYVVVDEPGTIANIVSATAKSFSAPLYIVACGDPAQSGHRDGKDYYLVDVAISMEHLVLAAAAEGLGTCWLGGMFDEAAVKKQLNIPDNIRVVAITPLGFPEDSAVKGIMGGAIRAAVRADSRKPLGEIVYKNKFGAPMK